MLTAFLRASKLPAIFLLKSPTLCRRVPALEAHTVCAPNCLLVLLLLPVTPCCFPCSTSPLLTDLPAVNRKVLSVPT